MPRLKTFGGLWVDDPAPGVTNGPRPRPLGLLAMLAAAGARGLTRDRVLGVLWAEADGDRARHALSQALYSLRRDIGPDAVASTPDLRLRALIPSDVAEFREAVAARRWADAAALYAGPFLDAFYLADAPEFERWVEEERAALAADGHRAIETAANEAAAAGRLDEARALWQRLARLDPFNARVAAAYMTALAAAGDRAAALAHGLAHADALRRDLDAEPDAAVRRLMAKLRDAPPPTPSEETPASPPSAPPAPLPPPVVSIGARPAPARTVPTRGRPWSRLAVGIATAAVVVAAVAAGWRALAARPAPTRGERAASDAAVAARAPVAIRLYEEGLRAFHDFDGPAAGRLFRDALREDSTFAMAAYYAWRAAIANGSPDVRALGERAVALAAAAAPRDSLLIVTHVGVSLDDVAALAPARALAERHPDDPEALVRAAEAIPELAPATALFERAIALDSAAGTGVARAVCRLCDAFNGLVSRYMWADSLDAAARTIRRWQALRPADPVPWSMLAEVRLSEGRPRDAAEAMGRYEALGGRRTADGVDALVVSLRTDDVDAANAECDRRLATGDVAQFELFRWYCAIALRAQGRHRDALALVRDGRAPGATLVRRGLSVDRIGGAVLDFEAGRALVAADEFRALAHGFDTARALPPGTRARNVAWLLTLAAAADVAAGDTIRARATLDSVRAVGQRSLFPRDPLLHHFVRGLLLARAARHEAAVHEFRLAMHSPTFGYTRVNYELGQSLLALGKPEEAIPVVRAVLRGGIEGAGLYLTRTEAHELLARLFAAAGARDSAAAHYAVVARAWRAADPPLRARGDAAREWLRAAGRQP